MYNRIVGDERQRFGRAGELVATNTKLGWVISGPCTREVKDMAPLVTTNTTHSMMIAHADEDKKLSEEVKNFWRLETIGIAENEKSANFKSLITLIPSLLTMYPSLIHAIE